MRLKESTFQFKILFLMVPAIETSTGGISVKPFDNSEKTSLLTGLEALGATTVPNELLSSPTSQKDYFLSPEAYRVITSFNPNSTSLLFQQEHATTNDFPATAETVEESLLSPEAYRVITSFNQNSTSLLQDHDFPATAKTLADSEEFPFHVIAIVLVVLFVMSSAFLFYLCRCLMRKKKRENHLASITPNPRMAGVIRASHPIEFVVPSTILLSENTDSVSETDYSSGSANILPILPRKRMRRSISGFHINPDDLQHGLYVGVKAASTDKTAFLGDLGKVGFRLSYNLTRNQLTVNLVGASNLPCHFLKTTANPCAKLVLLPDRTTKYMSKVQKNTMNPTFNESFVFCIRKDDLAEKRLKISVWDYDRFSRKCLIGQITYSVKDSGILNLMPGDASTGEIWVDLKPDTPSHSSEAGEMLFSLCYNADTANLTLTVLKVRGLNTNKDKGKDLSVYAKVTLYVRRKLVRTKKTPTRRKIPEVEFNNSFDVHVPNSALGHLDLLVTLCEKAPGLGARRVIGRTQVGANCLCDQGLQHWQDMLLSPKSTCAQWHVLCPP